MDNSEKSRTTKVQVKKAVPVSNSDSDSDDIYRTTVKRPKTIYQSRKRYEGGIPVISSCKSNDGTMSSMSAAEKKGKIEVEELVKELDLKNTFSCETNRRDEDAEMNRYIEEQLRSRIGHKKSMPLDGSQNEVNSETGLLFDSTTLTGNLDEDILLSMSRHQMKKSDEKSESMLSSQMLTGIPEVDLGMKEKIKSIEATEAAKYDLAIKDLKASKCKQHPKNDSSIPSNYASNFKHHRHSRISNMIRGEKSHAVLSQTLTSEPVVVVGHEPRAEKQRPIFNKDMIPSRNKPSDDYYLSRFKKNMQRR